MTCGHPLEFVRSFDFRDPQTGYRDEGAIYACARGHEAIDPDTPMCDAPEDEYPALSVPLCDTSEEVVTCPF